jgi:NTP pyrophosphatase (non-canonical NTP hydrolase)
MKSIAHLSAEIQEWREQQGFWTPSGISAKEQPLIMTEGDVMLGKLMLLVTEVAEAAEAVRHDDFDNFKEELADAAIRLLDITESCGMDLEAEIEAKMVINRQREHKHGKQTTL